MHAHSRASSSFDLAEIVRPLCYQIAIATLPCQGRDRNRGLHAVARCLSARPSVHRPITRRYSVETVIGVTSNFFHRW